ncbi:MAG TPA: AAA family ATPase, partial [Rhizomicrobium sp.]|nr:AAA family ATPase [Rhizomicrobium sp.]
KKKVDAEVVALDSDLADGPRPRLHKLVVRNFRSIGSAPVEIELDDVVILVGPNNAGKSSILRAYQVVMSHGSKEGRLVTEDFHNGIVASGFLPEIELHTIIHSNAPGERWISKLTSGELLIRERWIWESPNKDPVRQGFDVQKNNWDDEVPWGAPNIANARRPLPHRIDAFDPPDVQAKAIADIVTSKLKEKIQGIRTNPDQQKSDYELILDSIRDLQTKAVVETEVEIQEIEAEISKYLEKLFPNHRVKFDPRADSDIDKAFTPFRGTTDVLMGASGGHFSAISHQGSGARRTLLWAVLKCISEREGATSGRPHVLLLDEPEICLHPIAIREARAVLYGLPESGKWQVMMTSHSPIFIDLSRDNTTVVRVFRADDGVKSTTLYRPSRAKLSDDDKRNMKLLNLCDPYVNEFFFGGRQIIVEGDTEFTAFAMLRERYPSDYQDVQIIRARGKGVIPSIAKILLQFSKQFSVLHDSDDKKTESGATNPAWTMNNNIAAVLDFENAGDGVKLVACKKNFEDALFGLEAKNEKPYAALQRLRSDEGACKRVKQLLDCLLDPNVPPPENCVRWKKIADLE